MNSNVSSIGISFPGKPGITSAPKNGFLNIFRAISWTDNISLACIPGSSPTESYRNPIVTVDEGGNRKVEFLALVRLSLA